MYVFVNNLVCICFVFKLLSLCLSPPCSEMCGKCGEALSRTQPAVRAMEKLFHSDCFCCLSCQRPLQGLQFYDRDGAPQCDDCYTVRGQCTLQDHNKRHILFQIQFKFKRVKGHLLCKIHLFMSFLLKHVSPLCEEILKVSGKKIHSLFVLIHLYKNLSENELIRFWPLYDVITIFWLV